MCSAPILFSSSCSPLFTCNSLHSPPNRHARRERLSHRGRGGHLAKEEREGEPDDSSSSSSERLANEVGRQPTFLFRKKPRFSPSQRFFLPLESSAQTLSFKMSPLMVPDFRLLTTIGEWVAVGWLEGEGGERVFFSSSHSKTSCSRGVGKSWRSFFPFAFSLSQFSPFLHQLSLRISLLRRRPLFCSPTSPLPHRNANVEKTQTKTKNTPKKQTLSRPKKKKKQSPRAPRPVRRRRRRRPGQTSSPRLRNPATSTRGRPWSRAASRRPSRTCTRCSARACRCTGRGRAWEAGRSWPTKR